MYYGLSETSFSTIASQAITGDRYARIFLRLACFSTAAAANLTQARSNQFILSNAQLEQLKQHDHNFSIFIDGLAINTNELTTLEITWLDTPIQAESALHLPAKAISQQTLFTTPVWLEDLASGNYGPTICFRDLISAWSAEELPLSQLTGIVSIIDIESGTALMNESQIIAGIGIKGSNASDETDPRAKVELISPDDWFSLAQFGAVICAEPSPQNSECLTHALINNDFTAYQDEQAYFFMADVTVNDNTWIRREFSSAIYQEELSASIFTLPKNCKQHLEQLPTGTKMTILGKIHAHAESKYGGKLDTNIHLHGISFEIMNFISHINPEQLYRDAAYFSEVNNQLVELSQAIKLHCGHLKTETKQCHFQSVQNVRVVQALPNIIEVSKTGTPARDVLRNAPIPRSQASPLIQFAIWKKDPSTPKVLDQTTDNIFGIK